MKKIDFKKIDFKKLNLKNVNFTKINLKNKKTLWWIIALLILVLVVIFVFKGLKDKSIKIWGNNDTKLVDIASSKDYTKYEGKISAVFEGNHDLNFSFLHLNEIKVEQGVKSQARWFKLIDASSTNNVTLYFTYEGGRGYSANDYIDNVLKTNQDIKISDVKFVDEASSTIKYVLDENNNAEYYVKEIKGADGDSWLAIIENLKANDEISKQSAKDLIRSVEVK